MSERREGIVKDNLGVVTSVELVTNLTVGSVQLVKLLSRDTSAIGDGVVLHVSEDDRLGIWSRSSCVLSYDDGTTEDGVRSTSNQTRLPDVLSVVVNELANQLNSVVAHYPRSVLTVCTAKAVEYVDQIVTGDSSSS